MGKWMFLTVKQTFNLVILCGILSVIFSSISIDYTVLTRYKIQWSDVFYVSKSFSDFYG